MAVLSQPTEISPGRTAAIGRGQLSAESPLLADSGPSIHKDAAYQLAVSGVSIYLVRCGPNSAPPSLSLNPNPASSITAFPISAKKYAAHA